MGNLPPDSATKQPGATRRQHPPPAPPQSIGRPWGFGHPFPSSTSQITNAVSCLIRDSQVFPLVWDALLHKPQFTWDRPTAKRRVGSGGPQTDSGLGSCLAHVESNMASLRGGNKIKGMRERKGQCPEEIPRATDKDPVLGSPLGKPLTPSRGNTLRPILQSSPQWEPS
ncbi:hypothetical protein J6590_031600 [Homalodisca vitripennis]|nr:hypothetical protein J6590_031600 [Homalodisca vitripennis]